MHHFPPALWRVVVALTCVGLAYFCFVEYFIIKNARTDRDAGRDYLIVLGAAVYKDQPSLTLVRRLEGTKAYLDEHPETVAIVSGGMGKGETITEAQAMHDWLIAHGVAPERVIMEPKATSTMENLKYSFDIIRARGDEPQGMSPSSRAPTTSTGPSSWPAASASRTPPGVAAPWGYFFVMLNYFIREAFGVTHLWVFGN